MTPAEPIRQRRIVIVPADNPIRIAAVRELFQEYAASLSFNLCFQGFEEELARLPGEYAPWSGMLLLGLVDDRSAGCVAMHRLITSTAGTQGNLYGGSDVCEMKRLYVRQEFRGCGLGRELVDAILRCAAGVGYRCMRLDTVPSEMAAAVEMYRKLGFIEIEPYRANPIPGAKYLEIDIKAWEAHATAPSATSWRSRTRGNLFGH
jgi:ribosomal protein S18 acetylase RimI-like enzyme